MEHKKLSSFPSDFLWGSASAAYQVEGTQILQDRYVSEACPAESEITN